MKQKYSLLFTIVNIILYFVIVALWISIPDMWIFNLAVSAANLFISLFLIYLNQENFRAFYLSSHFQKLTDTLVFLALVLALLGLTNYWAFKHPKQVDITQFKLSELSSQTKSVLKNTPGKVVFKIMARKQQGMLWIAIADLYRAEKNDIEIEKYDIDLRPDLVQEYRLTDEATMVIEYNNKRQFVTNRDELNITNALIKISRASDPVAYFVTGHNEVDLNSKEPEGEKLIYEAIKNSAIDLRTINLTSTQEIPFDAKAVILWGPKNRLMKEEINVLERFLDRGGRLLVGLDPDLNVDANREIRNLLLKYHINVRNDLVIDRKSFVNGSNGTIPLVETYNGDHAITKKFKGQVFFPLVSSIEVYEPRTKKSDEIISFLAFSSPFPDSWGETNVHEIVSQNPSFTVGKDVAGPLNLVATYESSKNKMVVYGNSTFVLNNYLKFGNNFVLFLNSLSWLIDEDRLISLNLPIIQSERLFISAPQLGIIFYFSVLFSPILLIGVAIFTYRRKRVK